jgi:hypothetical protein
MVAKRLLLFLVVFFGARTALAQNSTTPVIVSFTSDLASITPDEAESGAKYANLAWQTSGINAVDQLHLQVFVLGAWHDALPDALPASGTLRWAVAHTLDFDPPKFRLVIRDPNGQIVNDAQLVIPYTTDIDPHNLPIIAVFWTTMLSFKDGSLMPVTWDISNRPAGSNLRFGQVLDSGQVINVELPRQHQWIVSNGEGAVRPAADGYVIHLVLELYDVASGNVYAQKPLNIPRQHTLVQPTISAFSANGIAHKRGDTLTVSWNVQQAGAVRIEIFDIDFSPVGAPAIIPLQQFNALPLSGSQNIAIPADYPGSGWQVILVAIGEHSDGPSNAQRIDVLFTDAKQPVMLQVKQFDIGSGTATRGETVTITWNITTLVRGIDAAGNIGWVPTHDYENQLWMDFVGIADMAETPASPFDSRFEGLPLVGSMKIQVPNYDPLYTHLWSDIGLKVRGEFITYDARKVDLKLDGLIVQTTNAAYQPFEHGFMIWIGATGEVRAFIGTTDGRVESFIPTIYEGFPDTSGTDTPPPGRIKPVNAFGRVRGGYNFRSELGWAISPEQGYTATLEYRTDMPGVLLSLPDGRKVYQNAGMWNFF